MGLAAESSPLFGIMIFVVALVHTFIGTLEGECIVIPPIHCATTSWLQKSGLLSVSLLILCQSDCDKIEIQQDTSLGDGSFVFWGLRLVMSVTVCAMNHNL